jgi:hypothetical protein
VHLCLGPQLEALIQAEGAEVAETRSVPSRSHGGCVAALITSATLQRFRDQAVSKGASDEAIAAAIAALGDPQRVFIGPTQWIVRCEVSS